MIRSLTKFFLDIFGDKDTNKAKKAYIKDAYADYYHNNEAGEIMLADLMEFAGFGASCYSQEMNEHSFEYIEGRRSVIHYMLQMIEISELDLLRRDKKDGNK